MEKNMEELYQLVQEEIPVGKRVLVESHANLKKVADYCEGNYIQAEDKRAALEETRNYTTQALASLAYQISTLATNFLHLLDLQTSQLGDIESSVHHLSQTVTIHKEKVARREIGVLTTNRSYFRPPGVKAPGIIYPEQPEKPVKYVRKAIDYSLLDDIGHGVKAPITAQGQPKTLPRTNSVASTIIGSGGSISRGSHAGLQAPGIQPPVPPSAQQQLSSSSMGPAAGIGTIGRSQYKTAGYMVSAAPVTPPTVPSHYMSTQQLLQAQQQQLQQQQQTSQPAARSPYASGMQQSMGVPPPPPPSTAGGAVGPSFAPSANGDVGSPGAAGGASAGVYGSSRMSGMPPLPPQPAQPGSSGFGQQQLPPPPSPQVTHYSQLPINLMGSGMAVPAEGYTFSEDFMPLPPPMSAMDLAHGDVSRAQNGRESTMTTSMLPPPPPLTDYGSEDDFPRVQAGIGGPNGISSSWIPVNYIEKVIAIYDYEQDKEDELTFQENTVIYVVKHNDDGWWEGVMAPGIRGLFPHNYVEPCI